jgi:TonB family protein
MAERCWWGREMYMKLAWSYAVAFVVMTCGLALARQSGDGSLAAPAFENGGIINNVYTNECFGFSFAIPHGWQLSTQAMGADGRAMHASKAALILLMIGQHREGSKEGSFENRIALSASESTSFAPEVQQFVSNAAHGQINLDREHREIVKDTYSVDYGSKHFSRADYKQTVGDGTRYVAIVYTKFRGYYIGEIITAGSPEELDHAANSLQDISFQEDEPNPKCVMRGDEPTSGIIGGVLSSKPPQPGSPQPTRVRVSQGVSTGLLIKKVAPHYPEDAKQARIQGQVVLQARIDKDGNIEDLTLVSGHPILAPAAIDAVKQWKYKPYLLNGQPVGVETQIIVNFQLSGH